MRRKGHEHMIAIIDYDAGNIKSVEKAMHLLGQEVVVTRDRESILKADKVILPGVGAFGDAMSKIRQYNLEEVIHEVVEKGTPFLGICLGLQLLFERSDETPGVEGLGILKGEIGLAKGKKLYDKRQDIAKKDQQREASRDFKIRNLG